MSRRDDLRWMRLAARLAVRGIGYVEPNPPVGCVIVRDGRAVGLGHHRVFGGPHAEIDTLRHAGDAARGATAYVTLEPCSHYGKTPPCTDALIRAGIARVVIARPDPHPDSSGGAAQLQDAGIEVNVLDGCAEATDLSEPFVMRVMRGRPWVIAKWAQTIDGRIATRAGESQWISNKRSRRLVHRWRGRVDAILTGIGTVLADDPMLTARVGKTRRIARRVVVDTDLRIPLDAKLVVTAHEAPTLVATLEHSLEAQREKAAALRRMGVELLSLQARDGKPDLPALLTHLAAECNATRVMVEAGGGLLGQLVRDDLLDEARVFVAPILLADRDAAPPVHGACIERLADAARFRLASVKRIDDDVLLSYRRLSSIGNARA
ncbi:MAG: bifunctional diaminohydroxyphosphoribosylaminopyrimidine deaminase/5-amino-6-(5-phosphoribosylamino)uracil reductase RibD [Phycisphaerales bacterium]|nr:bifunctional diaminohydroxyphosphoribosylaminopyrimidine deaminase/5-amino-6-(5-phosphoribosylamino)uracil reductase RibD [Phycisphaerales bacterium]